MEYNTARNLINIKEYGRHIQRMVEYIKTIDDRDKRNQQAKIVIEMMGFLNPHLRNVEDFRHILWDHLFFIADFNLDVDSPYPVPEKATYKGKPEALAYPKRKPRYTHLGKNVELLINRALEETNPEKKEAMATNIAYYMKVCYNTWHREDVQDDAVRTELSIITKGQLKAGDDIAAVKNNLDTTNFNVPSNSKKFFNNRNTDGPARPGANRRPSGGGGRNAGSRDPRRDERDKNNPRNNYKKRY